MATVKLLLDNRTQKKDGTYPLKLSISHKTETTYIGLDISVKKDQWNGTDIIDHPKEKRFNSVIHSKLIQAENILFQLSGKTSRLSLQEIKISIELNSLDPIQEPEPKQKYSLADHFARYINLTNNLRTKQIYEETLVKINKFAPKIVFEEVNLSWLRSFDTELAKTCKTNTRAIHMRNIRAVFNDAINEELVPLNLYPFRKFKIKKEKTIKRSLTVEQIKLIRDHPVQPHQEKYRDLFMLIFYLVGINIVDLLRLKEITNGRIEYRRAKTGRLYSIEVLPEAMAIIDKYKGKNYLLDVMDVYASYKDFAARMNENLQEIGKLEWVKNKAKETKFVKANKKKITPLFPDITTYWARHSWATVAAGLEIPKETISASLGHGGNETTDIYIDFDRKKIDKANREVLKAIL